MEFEKTKLGFSLGDPNGIGLEILIKAFENGTLFKHCIPVLYSPISAYRHYEALLETISVEHKIIRDADNASEGTLNILEIEPSDYIPTPGIATKQSGELAIVSLLAAVEDIKKGKIHNIVTLPIDKSNTHSENFRYAGHTDFLADTFGTEDYMMLLVNDSFRVGVVTGHIPLEQVSSKITKELLSKKIDILYHSLQFDFAIDKPKIAVLGLNPHSGDNGLIGSEELEVIKPTIDKYIREGKLIYGPYPADAFFGKKLNEQFDAVLAMYHDQGLIPFKQLAFDTGVNYTAGLPIVRTSPDHGTAFDIAGKNLAKSDSLVNAIFMAKRIFRNRLDYNEINKNFLDFKFHKREKFSIGVPNLK
ncbi:MAG: 4-hydroxythreonine-4-phosphate dehydrogenase PdxA [Flavobacteriales bacterium]|nr:4-hydroxythreonine-4-phosphate dehydrogenase PdxA [Flavobacteriales bacterium]